MSHLTRCPACATVFRVAESQLAARQGFVRCGQCAKVFDARASLIAEAALAPQAGAEAPEAALGDDRSEALAPPAAPDAVPAHAGKRTSEPDTTTPTAEPARPQPDDSPPSSPEPESAPAYEFGPQRRHGSRAARMFWIAGSALAVVALLTQGLYWFRTEVAVAWPPTRPYLEAACKTLGCTLPPPRHTALLSIESSELQVDRDVPGLLTLNATLRNRATFAQAHPSIELTLTDAADRPLARRVLGPADYLGDRLAREPLFPPASEHTVRLHIDATESRPAGYRMFLFHP